MAFRRAVRCINHDSHYATLWSRFGLRYKTAKNEECPVAAVCLLLLEFTSVYCFVCCIADFPTQTKAVDENEQKRRDYGFHAGFERVTALITNSAAFIGSHLLEF